MTLLHHNDFICNTATGNFYRKQSDGLYRQVECYLPAATHKAPEQYAADRFSYLDKTETIIRFALTASGYARAAKYRLEGGSLVSTQVMSQEAKNNLHCRRSKPFS